MTLFYKYHLRGVLEIQADLGQEPADPALGGNGAPKQVCDTPFVARLCNNLDLLQDILVGLDFGVSKDSYFITARITPILLAVDLSSAARFWRAPRSPKPHLFRKRWLYETSPMVPSSFVGDGIVRAQELQGVLCLYVDGENQSHIIEMFGLIHVRDVYYRFFRSWIYARLGQESPL